MRECSILIVDPPLNGGGWDDYAVVRSRLRLDDDNEAFDRLLALPSRPLGCGVRDYSIASLEDAPVLHEDAHGDPLLRYKAVDVEETLPGSPIAKYLSLLPKDATVVLWWG